MAAETSTDPDVIDRILDAAIAADPVRNTVLGTVRAIGGDRWVAWDGEAVAARSAAHFPVAISTGWTDVGPLTAALAELPGLMGLGGPPGTVDALTRSLGREVTERVDERLYRLDDLAAPASVPGRAAVMDPGDLDLLAGWYEEFIVEAFGSRPVGRDLRGEVAQSAAGPTPPLVWRDDGPVAMVAYRATGHRVHRVGPVYTPPEHRGRGYGSAITAAATQRILSADGIPILYTDLANPTSNAIYRRLGYYPVDDRTAVTFT